MRFSAVFTVLLYLHVTKCAPPDLAELEAFFNNDVKPITFQLESPVSPFIGRDKELSEIKDLHTTKKYVAITGPLGIGKTELAKKYAEQYIIENNGNVLWINSSSAINMIHDFEKLYKKVYGGLDQSKSRVEMVQDVFKYFKNRKSLFIIDDTPEDNLFTKHLHTIVGDIGSLDIIVTSRSSDFDNSIFSIVEVPGFSKAESVKYIKIALKDLDIDTSEFKCEKLAEEVEYLPLALKAMTNLIIKENNEGKLTTIDEILKRLEGNEAATTIRYKNKNADEVIERDLLDKIEHESKKIGGQIASGAEKAWVKISDGASYVGSHISYGAKEAGKELAKAGETVKNFFIGLG